jgi:hypothetical protein
MERTFFLFQQLVELFPVLVELWNSSSAGGDLPVLVELFHACGAVPASGGNLTYNCWSSSSRQGTPPVAGGTCPAADGTLTIAGGALSGVGGIIPVTDGALSIAGGALLTV